MTTDSRPVANSYTHGTGTTPLLGDTIGANLDRVIGRFSDREALVDVPSGRRWTYGEFGDRKTSCRERV